MVPAKSFRSRLARYCKAVLSETGSMLNVTSWFVRTPTFGVDQMTLARLFFDEHGWVIVRKVFTATEIAALRVGAARSSGEGLSGDVLMDPYIGGENFVLHDRFVTVVKGIVHGTPIHFGDASLSVGFQASPAFHKDNPDRQNGAGPDWQSPYTVVRFGLYLQNHRTHSGGLALRDYSHNTADPNQGRPFAVPTESGDLVIWSLRTTHSGFATRLRGLVNAFLPLTLMSLILGRKNYAPSRILFRPLEVNPRIALFSTFGVDDSHLHRFIKHLATRDYAVKHWRATNYTEAMRNKLATKGLGFIDMPEQTHDIDLSTLNVGYAPLPDN